MSNKINGLTPDEWYNKFTQALEKSSADFEKRLEKSSADFENWKKESSEDLKNWKKEMQKHIGGIAESNGDMAEEMIYNSLEKDMTFAGIEFDIIDANKKRQIKALNIAGEYDIVLTNGNTIAIIETKYKVRSKDITKLAGEKLEDFRKLFPEFSNYKILLGIGGMSFEDKAIDEAKENGIGIIKVVGDKVEYYTEGMKIY